MGKMSLTSCRALSTPGKFSNVDRYGGVNQSVQHTSTTPHRDRRFHVAKQSNSCVHRSFSCVQGQTHLNGIPDHLTVHRCYSAKPRLTETEGEQRQRENRDRENRDRGRTETEGEQRQRENRDRGRTDRGRTDPGLICLQYKYGKWKIKKKIEMYSTNNFC